MNIVPVPPACRGPPAMWFQVEVHKKPVNTPKYLFLTLCFVSFIFCFIPIYAPDYRHIEFELDHIDGTNLVSTNKAVNF